jgi:hypothetical protein
MSSRREGLRNPSRTISDDIAGGEPAPQQREPQWGNKNQDDLEEEEERVSGPQQPAQNEGFDTPNTEDEEYELLRQQVARMRRAREMQSMRDELAGLAPTSYVSIDGTDLPSRGRKRAASEETAEERFLRSIKLDNAPKFSGKDLKDLQRFDTGWKNIWRGRSTASADHWDARTRLAGQRLTGDAAFHWSRHEEVCTSWESFIDFLRGTVVDPEVQLAENLQILARKEQGPDQKVNTLYQEALELLDTIPERTHEEWKAWTFLLMLRPLIRSRLLREKHEVRNISSVLASALRHEQAIQLEERSTPRNPRPTGSSYAPSGASQKRPRYERREEKQSSDIQSTTEKKTVTIDTRPECFNCGKRGHKRAECRSAPKGGAGEKHASRHDGSQAKK